MPDDLIARLKDVPPMSVVGTVRGLIDRYERERAEAAAVLDAKDAEIKLQQTVITEQLRVIDSVCPRLAAAEKVVERGRAMRDPGSSTTIHRFDKAIAAYDAALAEEASDAE